MRESHFPNLLTVERLEGLLRVGGRVPFEERIQRWGRRRRRWRFRARRRWWWWKWGSGSGRSEESGSVGVGMERRCRRERNVLWREGSSEAARARLLLLGGRGRLRSRGGCCENGYSTRIPQNGIDLRFRSERDPFLLELHRVRCCCSSFELLPRRWNLENDGRSSMMRIEVEEGFGLVSEEVVRRGRSTSCDSDGLREGEEVLLVRKTPKDEKGQLSRFRKRSRRDYTLTLTLS